MAKYPNIFSHYNKIWIRETCHHCPCLMFLLFYSSSAGISHRGQCRFWYGNGTVPVSGYQSGQFPDSADYGFFVCKRGNIYRAYGRIRRLMDCRDSSPSDNNDIFSHVRMGDDSDTDKDNQIRRCRIRNFISCFLYIPIWIFVAWPCRCFNAYRNSGSICYGLLVALLRIVVRS